MELNKKMELVVINKKKLSELIDTAVKRAVDNALTGKYPEWLTTSQALEIIGRKSSITLHKYCDQYNIRRKYDNNVPYFNFFDLVKYRNQNLNTKK